jgi:D-3-phosphoglycerate dehydrogenase
VGRTPDEILGEMTAVLVTEERPYGHYGAPAGSPLASFGRLRRLEWTAETTAAEREASLEAALPGADALVASPWIHRGMPWFTPERWARADRLKVIAGTFDHRVGSFLDLGEASRRGVVVVDTARSMTPTVAEFALAMILNVLRDIPASIQLVRDGGWKEGDWDQPGYVYGDLTGRRVGLAGYGSINRRLAELLAPFRCEVAAYDPFVPDADLEAAGIRRVGSLPELAADSEIFVVGIPPTPATEAIVDAATIDALPQGAAFVLVTRMAVVDQEPLWRRTRAGEIRAAIDVFEPEPPPADAWFRTSPHVLPTPHIAGGTAYCHRRCFLTACEDAVAVLEGRRPVYAVNERETDLYLGKAVATT